MENSSNAETYALTAPGYAPRHEHPRQPRCHDDRPEHDGRPGLRSGASACRGYCSTGCGASLLSCAWITGEACSVSTSILRGLAFSLTGIVTFSTPLL
jgi:hypothetical protein